MEEALDTEAFYSETTNGKDKSSAFPEVAVELDIGTSQCSVAAWNGSEVQLLYNTRNLRIPGTYVTFKEKSCSGVVASGQLYHEPDLTTGATIFNMKRLIGRVDTDPIVSSSKNLPFLVQNLDMGVRPFIAALVNNVWRSTTPEDVLAIYLVQLRERAEAQLQRPMRNVVITVPVSFSRFQLARIERTCAIAGLRVLRMMPEPTAVALLYLQQQQKRKQKKQRLSSNDMGSRRGGIAFIFNMGSGYCDVAVVALTHGGDQSLRIKALAGSSIGGEDLLQNMMHFLSPESQTLSCKTIKEIKSMALLRVAAQKAIHRLSFETTVKIVEDLGDGLKNINKEIKRKDFEEVNKNVFEECESLIRRCLKDANVKAEDVNDVILVGGCSYVPKVKKVVSGMFDGKQVYGGVDPLEAAVRGAAVEGAKEAGMVAFQDLDMLIMKATNQDVGIRANGNKLVPLIPRKTRTPTWKEMVFTTSNDNQTEALIVVYEGDGEKKVEESQLLGYLKIVGIPEADKGVPEIKVRMDMDASHVVRVSVSVVMAGGSEESAILGMQVSMPNVDDAHCWCAEALNTKFGDTKLGLVTMLS